MLTLSSASTDGNVPHASSGSPIPSTVLAEMSRLVNIVIVKITKFRLHATAPRTCHWFFRFNRAILCNFLCFFSFPVTNFFQL
eukprot:Gb_23467 [translate_table: standard]